MKISIIIPTYNSEKYLKKTLSSITNQSYHDYEIIIADGGSSDSTVSIISSFPLAKIVSVSDRSQTDGINKAMAYCTGEIIAWQNSDDTYEVDCFANIVNIFKEENIDIVYGDYCLIDENDLIIKECLSHDWNLSKFKSGRFVPLQPTLFWRKKVSDVVFPLDIHLKFCMDVDFLSKAAKKNFRFYYLNKNLGSFRMHSAGKTSKVSDTLVVLMEHKKVLKNNFDLNIKERLILLLNITKLFLIKLVLNWKSSKIKQWKG